jgi:predicted alpha/beta-fold hydrolase
LNAGGPTFRAPRWLPGGHAQTIWPALSVPRRLAGRLRFRRERWVTPDGDFIDVDERVDDEAGSEASPVVDTIAAAGGARRRPRLVLFHGLEGSTASAYALAFAVAARERGWSYTVPHFRGCSGEINRAPRAYHSGDFEEIGWILRRLHAEDGGAPLLAVGISLGGNALLRWAEEAGDEARTTVRALAAVCAPLDLAASGAVMGRGFNRAVYTRMFLRTMIPKALAKWQQHPGLFDRERVRRAQTLHAFDDAFTAPLHGFRDADDYWRRASARPHLQRIRVPALLVNARNDPFVPAWSLPARHEVGPTVALWQPAHGGHVGFPGARLPGEMQPLPASVADWLATRL